MTRGEFTLSGRSVDWPQTWCCYALKVENVGMTWTCLISTCPDVPNTVQLERDSGDMPPVGEGLTIRKSATYTVDVAAGRLEPVHR